MSGWRTGARRRLAALCLAPAAALPALAAAPHLDLEVRLDPASRELRAVAELAVPPGARFVLHRALSVTAAREDRSALAVERGEEVDDLRVWRVDARPGARVRVVYGGTLPALDRRLDHRNVLARLPPMAARDGSFLPSGSGWYPAPGERFTYSVTLSLPAGQRGLVAGRLVAESPPEAAAYTARFVFEQAAEGIDLMAGPYAVRELGVPRAGAAPLRLRTYFTAGLEALAPAYLDDSRRYLERYERQIGAYPYTEFSIVASPLPTGFGMPTLAYLGAEVLKLPFIRATSLGHEVLHNWWGNGVYPDYATGNWSEGLTTFLADYAYKEDESPQAAREMRLAWLRDFAALPDGHQATLASFRSRTHGAAAAVGYGKAAMVFVMLRDRIGEEAFARGLQRFWDAHRFETASWDDLRAAFEQAAGRPLRDFFAQWLQRAGGPSVRLVAARAGGGAQLALSVAQTAPAYALRLPVELLTARGGETRWIEVDREQQTVTLDVGEIPGEVRLDPQLRVWRRLESAELPPILRQWILARAPRLALVSAQPAAAAAAHRLAAAFFEAAPRAAPLAEALAQREPVLVVGLAADVDAALARLGLPPRPERLSGRGSAQVWTVSRSAHDAPLAVVSARDAESLEALRRPLPHYGAQSYLVFEHARAVERGVWPGSAGAVPVSR